ncbi:MAG TPA: CAP domain-containing protein [Polyangiaceae bacterium]
MFPTLRSAPAFAVGLAFCLAAAGGCSSSKGTTGASGSSGDGGGASDPDGDTSGDGGASGNGNGDDGSSAPPTFDQFQVHDLDVVNQYRATLGVAPLALDHALSTFALAGSTELSTDHTPHQHIIDAINDGSVQEAGFGDQLAENQGDPNGWTILAVDPTTNELDQIDAIQKQMFDEGPGTGDTHDHYTNMMDPAYTRLGVGLLEVGRHLYLTNDFSD